MVNRCRGFNTGVGILDIKLLDLMLYFFLLLQWNIICSEKD